MITRIDLCFILILNKVLDADRAFVLFRLVIIFYFLHWLSLLIFIFLEFLLQRFCVHQSWVYLLFCLLNFQLYFLLFFWSFLNA